jgi:Helix-turn-helix domain
MRRPERQILGDRLQPAPSSGDETFLTDEELATRWAVSPKTLRNARVSGRLIGFVKIGRSVRYRMSDVIAFEEKHFVRSTIGGDE